MNTQFGAWIAAAITALQITLNSVGMPAQQISNFLSDPFNVVYTYQDTQLYDYFDQSNIQILPGNTVIDGVVYDDVWLSADAAEKFRVNAFDFSTAYSIASNTNGTYASGVGTILDVPIFNVSGTYKSQRISIPYFDGDMSINEKLGFRIISGNAYGLLIDGSFFQLGSSAAYIFPAEIEFTPGFCRVWKGSTLVTTSNSGLFNLVESPFEFDFVSGTIPADTPLSSDDGMLLHIPQHSGTSHLENFLIDNPEFSEPGGVVVDPTLDPDINTKLDDLINIIAPLIPVIQASFDTAPVPVPPSPGDTIADTDYSVLDAILQFISQGIQAIPQAISSLGDRILQDIEEGPIRVFDKVLDIFRTIFAPVISLITSGLSIWSYVISWINTISAPFTFILSVVPSGVMIPIYAAIAGFLCISIFKRFGK